MIFARLGGRGYDSAGAITDVFIVNDWFVLWLPKSDGCLGHWADLIHCSLNRSERLPTPPFDWGKLVYSVATQNPGLMRHAL